MSARNPIEYVSAATTTLDSRSISTLPARNIDLLNGYKCADNRVPAGVKHCSTNGGSLHGICRYPHQGEDN